VTITQQMRAADEYTKLWTLLMPHTPPPGNDQFLVWCGNYTSKQITKGINGAARKQRAMLSASQTMATDAVAAYASSIMKHEVLGQRCHLRVGSTAVSNTVQGRVLRPQ